MCPEVLTEERVVAYIQKLKRKRMSREKYRQLIIYVIGIALYATVILLLRDAPTSYTMVNAVHNAISMQFDQNDSYQPKTFWDIDNSEDFFFWLHGPLLHSLSPERQLETGFLAVNNHVLGSVTLRQYRVKDGSCTINKHIAGIMRKAFDENHGKAQVAIEFLKDNFYDDQTSAISVTINTFNPSVNSFLSSVFVVEFSPGGQAFESANFRPFRADFYVTRLDIFRLCFEILFLIWLFFQFFFYFQEIKGTIVSRQSVVVWLMKPWWNFVGVFNLGMMVVAVVWYLVIMSTIQHFVDGIDDITVNDDFEDMETLAFQWTILFYWGAFSLALALITLFRYLNANARMSILWSTLDRASGDIATFLLFFGIIFIGFVVSAHLIYGYRLMDYKDFGMSILSTYFVIFLVIVIFVLLNMFIAIINDAYTAVNEITSETPTLALSLRRV
eukprot:m51a1_g4065 putative polycystin-2 (444) ;mRNA; r:746837-748939